MTLPKTSILAIVKLVLYVPLMGLVLYLARRHGRHGAFGYFYLNIACALRPASDIVTLVDGVSTSATPSMASVILGSIGLTPVLLAIAGFLHELHLYLRVFDRSRVNLSARATKNADLRLWLLQLHIHGLVIAAMALFITGGVKEASASSAAEFNSAMDLRKAGAIILVLVWGGLLGYALHLVLRTDGRSLDAGVLHLAYGTKIATIFIGARVIYTVVYVFDNKDTALNPYTDIAVDVVCIFLLTFIAVLSLLLAGWRSVSLANKAKPRSLSREEPTEPAYTYSVVAKHDAAA